MNIEVGLRGEATLLVGPADTARAMKTGSVDVLATPRVIALCEEAAVQAVEGRLPPGHTTVGMRVQVDHLQPTGIGAEVVAEATLEKIDGRRLMFTVSASDTRGLVAAGKVTRVLVEVDRFLSKLP
ncbi:MAG: thioesterase family protein [Ilumatobacteraceae bacterium]